MSTIARCIKEHCDFSKKELLKKAALWFCACVLLLGYVYTFGRLYDRPSENEYYIPEITGTTEPLAEGSLLTQTFVAPCDKLRALYLSFDASDTTYSVMYLVTLYDVNGEVVMQNDFKTGEATSPVNVLLSPLQGLAGNTYTLELKVVRTMEHDAARFVTMQDTDFAQNAVLDGKPLDAPLALQFNNQPNGQLATYKVVAALAVCLFAGILLLSGKKPVMNTVIMVAGIGLFVAMLNPLGDVPDEHAHALRAQTLAQGKVFCYSDTLFEADANIEQIMTMGSQSENTFARFSDAHLYAMPAGQESVESTAGTAGNYFFIGYLASALGLKIGTAAGISAMSCLYLARVLNVLYYAALCGLAVAISPGYKRVLSFLACFPNSIFLAASFSPDGITIALGFISIALFLRLREKAAGQVQLWQPAVWLAVTACMALTRIPYICLLPLILLLPKSAYARKNGKRWVWLQLGIAVALAGVWTMLSGLRGLRVIEGADAGAQLHFLLTNLGAGVNAVLGTMFLEIYTLYKGFFNLGWNTYDIAWLGLLLPFVLMWLMRTEKPLPVSSRACTKPFFGVAFCVWCATYLGMYITSNVVGAPSVTGIQGRYFIELLMLVPVALAPFAQEKRCWRYASTAAALLMNTVLISAILVAHYL